MPRGGSIMDVYSKSSLAGAKARAKEEAEGEKRGNLTESNDGNTIERL
jgi:hypothetical protein